MFLCSSAPNYSTSTSVCCSYSSPSTCSPVTTHFLLQPCYLQFRRNWICVSSRAEIPPSLLIRRLSGDIKGLFTLIKFPRTEQEGSRVILLDKAAVVWTLLQSVANTYMSQCVSLVARRHPTVHTVDGWWATMPRSPSSTSISTATLNASR